MNPLNINIKEPEAASSLLKLDMPIGKLNFFVNSIILFLLHLLGIGLYYVLYFITGGPKAILALLCSFIVIIGIPLLYLNFINYAKRLWDITDSKKLALIINTIWFIISGICIFVCPILIVTVYLILIFYPGKHTEQE